jgi:hypothetical protein
MSSARLDDGRDRPRTGSHERESAASELEGVPAEDWTIGGWTGTDDDGSTDSTNTLTMPDTTLHIATVDYVPTTPRVDLAGTCPGQIDVTVSNAVPDRKVAIYIGGAGGTTQIPAGSCAGTELDLSPARKWQQFTTNPNGEVTFSFLPSAGWCNRALQAVDFSCTPSNAAALP